MKTAPIHRQHTSLREPEPEEDLPPLPDDALKPDDAETERESLIGVDHVAYTYDSLDDLLENYEQLKVEGIMPYWCVHHGLTVSMYYADPDGNPVSPEHRKRSS